jgi:uncharacterized protein involved in response to NO
MHKTEHFLVLVWLLVTGLVVFGFVVCWDTGLLQTMVQQDHSYISVVVIAIYLVGLLHSFGRTWVLSRELNLVNKTTQMLASSDGNAPVEVHSGRVVVGGGTWLPQSFLTDYLVGLAKSQTSAEEPMSSAGS